MNVRLLQQYSGLLYLIIGLSFLFAIILAIVLYTQAFGQSYSRQLIQPDLPRQQEATRPTFSVRRINLQVEGLCGAVEVLRNGQATRIGCNDRAQNRIFLSNERLRQLFGNLTQEEFEALQGRYFLEGLEEDLILTIETNYGTKTITLTGSDSSAPSAPDVIGDIIDEFEDIDEELDLPPATPPPAPSPTPTPPGGGPTPPPNPTPTPTPLPPGATPEPEDPFDCSMIDQFGVTVSNIRCLEDDL